MSRFNINSNNPRETSNFEGGTAFTLTPQLELYSKVCTASLQNKFYTTANQEILDLRKLIGQVDPELVCKLAVYAREKMYLRSVPLVLLVELFKYLDENKKAPRNGTLLRKTVTRIIQRADEITEILAYFTEANNRTSLKKLGKLPNALKRGISEAFNKFDAYQLAKYNSDKAIKLRDALFLSHPKPKDEQTKLIFDNLAKNELEAPYTWEVELSRLGQQKFESDKTKTEAFSLKWQELIESDSLGYMALLRNLRNFAQKELGKEVVNKISAKLINENAVLRSKQLPFRFFSAYRELNNAENVDPFTVKQFKTSLEKAVHTSVRNIKGFNEDTRVLIACDVSGSMQTPISEKSTVERYDIGLLLGQVLQSLCKNVVTGFFGDTWKQTDFAENNILANTLNLRSREGEVGYSTNGHLVINWLNQKAIEVDKVMIFTDCQMWNSLGGNPFNMEWKKYLTKYPNSQLYLFDLAGHGTSPVDVVQGFNTTLISGWSEKIFEVLDAVEKGKKVIDIINEITL